MHGAGQRSGAAPISCTEAPAARSDAIISRGGHPGGETGRLGDKQRWMGLTNLRRRAEKHQGRVDIVSTSRGTTLSLNLQLHA